jgi:hypothetical protein
MPATHPNAASEVLAYIESMPAFSKAVCLKLRSIILKADKNIVEDWKWGPNYSLQGMLCGFSGFRHHAKLTFYNGSAMKDSKKLFNHCVDNEFNRSIKYTDAAEVDEKAISEYVKDSIRVNKSGFKRVVLDKEVIAPADLQAALSVNKKANAFFDGLSYGYKKDFVEWVTSAKRDETRQDRISKTVRMCSENRKMNDKYKPAAKK